VPNSIATLRRRLIVKLVANLSRCPCCALKIQARVGRRQHVLATGRIVVANCSSESAKFFFYEVIKNEAAFAAHQQTAHFKKLIAGEALAKLDKRERAQYSILP